MILKARAMTKSAKRWAISFPSIRRARIGIIALVVLGVGITAGANISLAQTSPSSRSTTNATVKNESLYKRLSREKAARRERRVACERQALEQHLRYYKRLRFIRRCSERLS